MEHCVKTTIYITKELVIFLLFLSFNIYIIVAGVDARQKYENRIELSQLSERNCETGGYVCGTIEAYVGYMHENTTFMGTNQVRATLVKDYALYTIPAGEGQFIRIWIGEGERWDALKAFQNGYGKGVSFEGELVELPMDDHYISWCDKVEREDFAADKVIAQYAIQEISFEKKKGILDAGIVLLVVSAVQLLSLNGIIYWEAIPQKQTKMPYKLYQVKDTLEAEERRLSILEKRLSQLKKDCFWQIPVLLIGIYIIITIPFIEIAWIGIALFIYAGRQILMYVLNSGTAAAERMMRLFDKESLACQIKESREFIDELKIRMEDFS